MPGTRRYPNCVLSLFPGLRKQRIRLRGFFLFIAFFASAAVVSQPSLDDPDLAPGKRSEIIRQQEDLWDMRKETSPVVSSRWDLAALLPRTSVSIRNDRFEQVYSGGLTLEIPAGTFPGAETEVRVIVLQKPADFLLAGIALELPNGHLLESSGMFNLEFRSPNGTRMQPSRPIVARFLSPKKNADVRMYKRETAWNEAPGKVESRTSSDCMPFELRSEDSALAFQSFPVNPPPGAPRPRLLDVSFTMGQQPDPASSEKNAESSEHNGNGPMQQVTNPANPNPCEGNDEGPALVEWIYRGVSSDGWWNFDTPKPEFTCIKLSEPARSDLNYVAVGVDYLGMSFGQPINGRIYFNVLKNSLVKVVALSTSLDPMRTIGWMREKRTPARTAHIKTNTAACSDFGSLLWQKVEAKKFKDKDAFLALIEMQ